MPNPLFNGNPQNGGNMFGLFSQFQQFKQNFKGDPREQVQQMLNSGQMTQEQLEQCEKIARSFQGFLH